MAIDIAQNIQRFPAGTTKQFTLTMSPTPPTTADFVIYGLDGTVLPLSAVQSGEIVGNSGAGLMYINRVLPQTAGVYDYEWLAWDTASRPYIDPGQFEIVQTRPYYFPTYGDAQDIVRSARGMFGRTDITWREMQPYCQAADGYIDMYFGRVTTVPLGSASPLLQDMSKVYTLWRFYCDQFAIDTEAEPPAIIHRKEDYDKLLEAIAAGSLGIPGIEPIVEFTTPVLAIPDGRHKAVFDMRDFAEQDVSQSLLDEEEGRGW